MVAKPKPTTIKPLGKGKDNKPFRLRDHKGLYFYILANDFKQLKKINSAYKRLKPEGEVEALENIKVVGQKGGARPFLLGGGWYLYILADHFKQLMKISAEYQRLSRKTSKPKKKEEVAEKEKAEKVIEKEVAKENTKECPGCGEHIPTYYAYHKKCGWNVKKEEEPSKEIVAEEPEEAEEKVEQIEQEAEETESESKVVEQQITEGIQMISQKPPILEMPGLEQLVVGHSKEFIFRMPNGQEVGRAQNLDEFAEMVRRSPLESVTFHTNEDHFSHWLELKGYKKLAEKIKNIKGTSKKTRKRILKLISRHRPDNYFS